MFNIVYIIITITLILLLTTIVLELGQANQIPQGAWLLAAKENKLHELSMRLRRFVEIMACVVLPFGYFMTIVHPMLVFALYSVYVIL